VSSTIRSDLSRLARTAHFLPPAAKLTSPGGEQLNVEQFRKRAEECRQLAALKTDPFDREFWLRLAEDWMSVVLEVDKPRRPGNTVSGSG
jgi:hypothetical protein